MVENSYNIQVNSVCSNQIEKETSNRVYNIHVYNSQDSMLSDSIDN